MTLKRIAGTTCATALMLWPLVAAPARADLPLPSLGAGSVGDGAVLPGQAVHRAAAPAASTVTLVEARITLDRGEGEAGSAVTGRGTGFDRVSADAVLERVGRTDPQRWADAPVIRLHWGSADGDVLWKGTAEADGSIAFRFDVPAGATPGDSSIVATQEGRGAQAVADATFRVIAPAAQPPASGAPAAPAATEPPAGTSIPQATERPSGATPPGPRPATADDARAADRRAERRQGRDAARKRRAERRQRHAERRQRRAARAARARYLRDYWYPGARASAGRDGRGGTRADRGQSPAERPAAAAPTVRSGKDDGSDALWILVSLVIVGGLLAATTGIRVLSRRRPDAARRPRPPVAAALDAFPHPLDAEASDLADRTHREVEPIGRR